MDMLKYNYDHYRQLSNNFNLKSAAETFCFLILYGFTMLCASLTVYHALFYFFNHTLS